MKKITFIIPAYNEEEFIGDTIDSIRSNIPDNIDYDLIIVDHGSLDATKEIAQNRNAQVISHPTASTISELRNVGSLQANSEYLIFVDADTSLTSEWKNNILSVLSSLEKNPNTITGSKRVIPDDSNWLNKAWFYSPKEKYSPGHLGGGHMIFPSALFKKIGGFSTEFETGEDFEICHRARKFGAEIISHPELRAIHRGIPINLKEYFSREVWHGRGDSKSISLILASTVSKLSIIFLLLHLLLITSLFISELRSNVAIFSLALIFFICFTSSLKKSKTFSLKILLSNTFLFYVYYWARVISIADIIKNRDNFKRSRKV